MKETDFIKQNASKWSQLEAHLREKSKRKDYKNLSDSFVQLTEDLSYAQTYYRRRSVRVYLNNMAQRLYKTVFNTRRIDKTGNYRFWSHELPTSLWESRIELLLALAVFLLAVFVGVVSSRYEDGFAQQILGANYVRITEENIAKGDPMGIYKDSSAVEMFFRIMINNLQVSVITFILGVLAGVGTVGILVRNGVMLGVFQYFFVQRGIGFESFLTIWQHGTIEIASIVVAGGAGLVLGKSILFPGTLPRSISLKFGALKGLKVLLGVAPLIILAAFIESFYTRFDDLPTAFRLATILASLAFIIGYYIVLPIKRGRSTSLLHDVAPDYSESHVTYTLNLNTLKRVGEILSDTLVIVQRNLLFFIRSASVPAMGLTLAILFFLRGNFTAYYHFTPLNGQFLIDLAFTVREVFLRLELFGRIFNFDELLWLWPLMAGFIAFCTRLSTQLITALITPTATTSARKTRIQALLHFGWHALFLSPMIFSLWYLLFYFFFGFPVAATLWYIVKTESVSMSTAAKRATKMIFSGLPRTIGIVLIGVLFSLLGALLVQSPTFYIFFELGNDFIGFSEGPKVIIEFAILFTSLITLFCGIQFMALLCILNYRNTKEITEANALLEQIENLKLWRK